MTNISERTALKGLAGLAGLAVIGIGLNLWPGREGGDRSGQSLIERTITHPEKYGNVGLGNIYSGDANNPHCFPYGGGAIVTSDPNINFEFRVTNKSPITGVNILFNDRLVVNWQEGGAQDKRVSFEHDYEYSRVKVSGHELKSSGTIISIRDVPLKPGDQKVIFEVSWGDKTRIINSSFEILYIPTREKFSKWADENEPTRKKVIEEELFPTNDN